MLIDSCDFVYATVFALGFVVEELAVVGNVLYATEGCLLDALVVDDPSDVRWWFADDLHVEVESFVLAYGDVTQVPSVDLWCN